MNKNKIRPLALCVFLHQDRILVAEGRDDIKGNVFYRPLGGGIEFGETGAQAVRRELREELNVAVEQVRYLGTLENIFTFNGRDYHEIVMLYDGALSEPGLYEQAVIEGQEANGAAIRAVWKSLREFEAGESILYPTGLAELLRTG